MDHKQRLEEHGAAKDNLDNKGKSLFINTSSRTELIKLIHSSSSSSSSSLSSSASCSHVMKREICQ